jgi:adenylate cyclase
LFSVFQSIIESNGGKIIETAGDGIYAVFGCDLDRTKSAQSAVQSGLSIIENLEQLNETYFLTHFQEIIQVGIGIHIGKVITGTIRIGAEDHTVVMGFPVNVASRLQSATKELNNSLIISSDLFKLIGSPQITSAYINNNNLH